MTNSSAFIAHIGLVIHGIEARKRRHIEGIVASRDTINVHVDLKRCLIIIIKFLATCKLTAIFLSMSSTGYLYLINDLKITIDENYHVRLNKRPRTNKVVISATEFETLYWTQKRALLHLEECWRKVAQI